eukprot:scaffold12384_cov23-Tisochrysis_lutea.AAC.1
MERQLATLAQDVLVTQQQQQQAAAAAASAASTGYEVAQQERLQAAAVAAMPTPADAACLHCVHVKEQQLGRGPQRGVQRLQAKVAAPLPPAARCALV